MSISINTIKQAALRLKGFVHTTPVLTSKTINKLTGYKVFFKCENFQRMGAFKFRGAFNAISKLTNSEKSYGVVTHSSGNHAQAIAMASKLLNTKSVVVMPKNAPQVKIDATRGYGARIVFCEPTETARIETTQQLIKENNYTLIHPYDNENVIEGAGTACLELLNETGQLNAILAPVGGGGLISGTSIVAKESGLVEQVFGAEPINANDAYQSFNAGKIISITNPNTIADGLRTTLSKLTFGFIKRYVDDILTVSEEEIIEAMKVIYERMKIVIEPSGAVPSAALMLKNCPIEKGSTVGIIISGGNIDLTSFFTTLQKLISIN